MIRSLSTQRDLSSILLRVANGDTSPSTAASQLAPLLVSGGAQAEDVGGFAKIDHDRRRRVGFPEVVFGDGKSAEQIVDILKAMIRDAEEGDEATAVTAEGVTNSSEAKGRCQSSPIVATRVSSEKWSVISASVAGLSYHSDARIVSYGSGMPPEGASGSAVEETPNGTIGKVAVLSAGTSDLAVAEEAAVLAELAGAEVMEACYILAFREHDVLAISIAVYGNFGIISCVLWTCSLIGPLWDQAHVAESRSCR